MDRHKPLTAPDASLIDNVPPGWEIVALDLLIDRIEAGKSFRASGRPASDAEWGVIKVSAMSWGSFREDENKAILEGHPINPDYEINTGDLLISRANTEDLVGATVLVGETRPRLLLSDKSLRLVPRHGVNTAWLSYALRSPLARAQFSARATGTSDSMRNLSQEKILSTTLLLPPPSEQAEIVRQIDELLGLADRLQDQIDLATRDVDRSSQAVLTKVFRGELAGERSDLSAVEEA